MVVWWNKECAFFPLGMWGQIDAPIQLVDQFLWIMAGGGIPKVK